jgi:DNA replication protein DnaC
MSEQAPEILLGAHLKALKLPTVLREHQKLARLCALEGVDHVRYLARLVEMELIDRERRMVERRIKAARFPAKKSLDTFDFAAIPKLNKMLVLDLRAASGSSDGRTQSRWAQRHGQDAHRHRAWHGGLPEGPVRRLHHGGGPGQRDD